MFNYMVTIIGTGVVLYFVERLLRAGRR